MRRSVKTKRPGLLPAFHRCEILPYCSEARLGGVAGHDLISVS